jgi:hypothetical protein
MSGVLWQIVLVMKKERCIRGMLLSLLPADGLKMDATEKKHMSIRKSESGKKGIALLLVMIVMGTFLSAVSAETPSSDASELDIAAASPDMPVMYIGFNPMSFFSFLPMPAGLYVVGFGAAAGNEYGISMYGGIFPAKGQCFELRVNTGPFRNFIWGTQFQAGYLWYPGEQ